MASIIQHLIQGFFLARNHLLSDSHTNAVISDCVALTHQDGVENRDKAYHGFFFMIFKVSCHTTGRILWNISLVHNCNFIII